MNTPFTPGIWTALHDENGYWVGVPTDDNRYGIVATTGKTLLNADAKANADLIAAAPDLLAACELALAHITTYRERVMKGEITGNLLSGDYAPMRSLRDAIRTAKGQ